MTIALKDQEEYSLGSLTIRALHTPCHTRGHILFYVTSSSDTTSAPLVFSGDTLFVGGCGRFFEGDASQSERISRRADVVFVVLVLTCCLPVECHGVATE